MTKDYSSCLPSPEIHRLRNPVNPELQAQEAARHVRITLTVLCTLDTFIQQSLRLVASGKASAFGSNMSSKLCTSAARHLLDDGMSESANAARCTWRCDEAALSTCRQSLLMWHRPRTSMPSMPLKPFEVAATHVASHTSALRACSQAIDSNCFGMCLTWVRRKYPSQKKAL